MVGRVLLFLSMCLQPIPSIIFLMCNPGRETQDLFLYMIFAQALAALLWQTGRVYICLFFLLLYDFLAPITRPFRRHHRKHGRWKFRQFYPSTFLLLSSVALSHTATIEALSLHVSRSIRVLAAPVVSSPPTPVAPSLDVLSMCVDTTCPANTFFHDSIFDFLPFEEFDEQGETRPCLLHLSGFSREWIASTCKTNPIVQPVPDFVTRASHHRDSLPESVSHHFSGRLSHTTTLCPSISDTSHLSDLKFFLRSPTYAMHMLKYTQVLYGYFWYPP